MPPYSAIARHIEQMRLDPAHAIQEQFDLTNARLRQRLEFGGQSQLLDDARTTGHPPFAPKLAREVAVPLEQSDLGSAPRLPRRYHGTVALDPARVGRGAGRIADEVIPHLAGQIGADVRVTLEIEATLPHGASDQVVRTVTEKSRTLKFGRHGFESE
jgi:hypothetical protein